MYFCDGKAEFSAAITPVVNELLSNFEFAYFNIVHRIKLP